MGKAGIKPNEFAKQLCELKAYLAFNGCLLRRPKYIDLKNVLLKVQKRFMTDGKKLFMGLKIKYCCCLKKMI